MTAGGLAHAEQNSDVLIVPARPGVDTAAAVEAVEQAGFRALSMDDVQTETEAALAELAEREKAALAKIASGLESARANYLEQDFADMIANLEDLREDSLWLTSRPDNRKLLWEFCFQIGLGYQARGSKGDTAAAKREFVLANLVDSERRPPSDIYGPDVGQAFAQAVAGIPAAPKPFRVDASPASATITVDGVPLIGTSGRAVSPGLHVVVVSSPGFLGEARIVDSEKSAAPEFELEERSGTIAEVFVASWVRGDVRPGTEASAKQLSMFASEQGAAAALWVGEGSPAEVIWLDPNDATASESDATTSAALKALLARINPNLSIAGRDQIVGPGTPRDDGGSNTKWLIAGGIGVAVVAIVVTGVVLASGSDGGGNGGGDRIEIGIVP